jgi:RNA polymerase sigma-70 factor (ECF subfamily)
MHEVNDSEGGKSRSRGGCNMVADDLEQKRERQRLWDEQVRTALAAGDVYRAWDALVRGYQDVVVGYCGTLLGDRDAGEEVAHEVFLAAYTALARFQQKAAVRTWLFAIARKICMKRHRWTTRLTRLVSRYHSQVVAEVSPEPPASPEAARLATEAEREQDLARQQRLTQLDDALRRLPKRDRALLMMYYVEGLSYRVIAQQLWVSESTVGRRMRDATDRFKQFMAAGKGSP